jgi:formate hydrogenlyase transcriptional activator
MQQNPSIKDKVPPAPATLATEVDPCRELRTLYNILKTNESRLELAAEAAYAGLWVFDITTNAVWANSMIRQIFAFPDDVELTFQMFIDKIHPADHAAVMAYVQRALAGERILSVEYRIVLSEESVRWIYSRGRLYHFDEGNTSCLMGASADITERKEHELSLARQLRFEELLAEISVSLVAIVSPVDMDRTIESALARLMAYFEGDRCALIEIDLKNRKTYISAAFYKDGLERVPPDTELAPLFPWVINMAAEGKCVCFSDLAELPPEAEIDRQSWLATGVISALLVPLRCNESICHLILVQSLSRHIYWHQEMIHRLQIIGEVFSHALYKKMAEEALRRSCEEVARLKEKLEVEADYLRAEVLATRSSDTLIGQSEPLKRVRSLVNQVAPTGSTVLICGETGTGKELIAQAIHQHSSRSGKLMVKVNCASLPSSLVESELFGREKGAYTGALTRQIGRFELANGSTIFLDEISEMSLELQAKLLRVLQEGEFERLGSPTTIKVDVRVIAATNRNLLEEVAAGRFRNDLYYRLNVFPIIAPPLREHSDDVPILAWEFVREFNEKMGRKIRKIAKKDMALLQAYPWPGNVRELRNVIEHGVIISTGDELKIRLPEDLGDGNALRSTIAEMECKYIQDILKQTNWRIKGEGGAAQILGMNPSTLYFRMKKLGIDPHCPRTNA